MDFPGVVVLCLVLAVVAVAAYVAVGLIRRR